MFAFVSMKHRIDCFPANKQGGPFKKIKELLHVPPLYIQVVC